MEQLKEKIAQSLKQSTKFQELQDKITMVVTGEGLRIELMESDVGTFFESGSPVPTEQATEIIGRLAQEVGQLPNKVFIEGHTDSKQFAGEYSNWELSSDRANTARRIMQAHGVRGDQVAQIRGFADQRLRKGDDAGDPSNRRISIIVQHLQGAVKKPKEEGEAKKDEHGEAKKNAHGEAKPDEHKKDEAAHGEAKPDEHKKEPAKAAH
jgi:chemotaxis protein MotB